MFTRSTSKLLLIFVGTAVASSAFGQSPPPQTPSIQSPVGTSAQASGQGAVAVGGSGVAAQGSGSSEAAARAGDSGAELAADSSVNAVLAQSVDSRKSKPGDPVKARTTQPTRTSDGTPIPTGSTLMGHVSEVRARGEGHSDSALGIVFDKAVTKDGREIALHHVAIRALAAAETAASGSVSGGGMTMGAGGMGAGGMAAGGSMRGGGLAGRTTGTVGGALGGGLGAAGGVTGSVGETTGGALRAGPNSGLDGSGFLRADSSGVFGLRDLSLSSAASSTSQGSLVTSAGKSVHLDSGTRFLLSSGADGTGRRDREQAAGKPSASEKTERDQR